MSINECKEMGICVRCRQNEVTEGKLVCEACRQKTVESHEIRRANKVADEAPKKRKSQEETLDDIARKAHEHHMSYGQYLQARAQGRVK